jgi:predicted negative regulator of RcsB-dependent stress response
MAYDLEEQEQLDGAKAFWRQYGKLILTLSTLLLLTIGAWRGWAGWQARQAAEASVVFAQLQQAAEQKDIAKVKEAAGQIFERYAGTAYGELAAMVAARAHVDAGDLKSAKAPLRWAADKAADEELRHPARIRLAGILIDEKAYDEALQLVGAKVQGRFAPLYADRRGDVLVAQGKLREAKAAYEDSLAGLVATDPLRRLIQLKVDVLGGEGA